MSQPPDPEETAPFTHQPYGSPPPPPPGPGVPPQWSSPPPPNAYGGTPLPAYGAPWPGSAQHPGATRAMWLGIVALGCLAVGLFCCLTIPGVLCAPFAWVIGARAKRAIDAQPGVYGNRSQAQAGVVMGIIGTVLGFLVIAGFTALAIWLGTTDYSLV